jgi:hypothetical protein
MSEIKQEGSFKLQKKKTTPKKLNNTTAATKVEIKEPEVAKVELKSETDAVQEQSANESLLGAEESAVGLQEVGTGNEGQEIASEGAQEEVTNIEEIEIAEEPFQPITAETVQEEAAAKNIDLPENVDKLIMFMRETGGTIEDYARLNVDYSKIDAGTLLREYYRNTRPHLNSEEIEFLMEDKFSYEEDIDDERDIRKKKLAFKEEVANAKAFLEGIKNKYYDEIKLRPSINKDQQKALDFFNRYNEDQALNEQRYQRFKANTKAMFSNEFKGFEFNLGEKSFRYGVNNVDAVAEKQADINNVIKKFLNKDGEIADYKGYHKALYAADNIDSIAKHFYEQGKADAVKDIVAKSNNITTEPRQNATSLNLGGFKVKAVNGVDSSKLKIQKRF